MVQRAQYRFRALQDCFQHLKNFRTLDCVTCSRICLRAGNNPVVPKSSTEHAEPLFIALVDQQLRKRFECLYCTVHIRELSSMQMTVSFFRTI